MLSSEAWGLSARYQQQLENLEGSAVTLRVPCVLAPAWVTTGSAGCSDVG